MTTLETILAALEDAAYYRLGSEAADVTQIEDETDRERFTAYRALEAVLSARLGVGEGLRPVTERKGIDDLIEALTLVAPFASAERCPTHCEHDVMVLWVVDPANVPDDVLARVRELGFAAGVHEANADQPCLYSARFGSA